MVVVAVVVVVVVVVVDVGSATGGVEPDFGVVAEREVAEVPLSREWDGGKVAEPLQTTNAARAEMAAMETAPSVNILRDGRLRLSCAAPLAICNSFAALSGSGYRALLLRYRTILRP